MIDKYREKSLVFFEMLVKSEYSAVRQAFCEMMRECAMKCAVEAADHPAEGIGQWSGGRISICREWTDAVESALARAKGEANPNADVGLAYPPI